MQNLQFREPPASLLPFISGAFYAPINPRGPHRASLEWGAHRPSAESSVPPKSFARMGSAESEVGSTAAELQVIPTFLPTLLGPPESFARMGSAESEVGSTAAEQQVIPTFLMNAHRPHSASAFRPAFSSRSLCEFGNLSCPFALRF